MPLSFLPYAKQSIQPEDIQAVAAALKEDFITRGPPVQAFEEAIAAYCGVRYAVAFTSGTAALMAAYFAAKLTPADRVFSTPNTFIATVGMPIQMGICPHFIDIDRKTGNLDLNLLGKLLKAPSTRGRPVIVPVHFAGLAMDMRALDHLICDPEAVVIEDAAHALGSFYPTGEKVGSCAFSQMTIFSFHPAKTLTTGEGGMVTTNDEGLYHRLLLYRDNGIERYPPYLQQAASPGYYEVQAITGNFHFTSFQAALGLSQFKRLDDFIDKRRRLVRRYRINLKDSPGIGLLTEANEAQTAFHLFVVQIDFESYGLSREWVIDALKKKGIGVQVHYIPLYHHPVMSRFYQDQEWKDVFPETEKYYAQTLSLPLYFDLSEEEVDYVCQSLFAVLGKYKR
ncbi:DegT/DnrJ/EryC1/StrS family aminotransferase [Candidatus Protochlamydia phocaeensis]|uniref:DegT/DnrJ/EryC1/StrS family aminotransferase n=1 Tax=Candidatus Protochlamydia phocaeensis TaxID=1414722 RepID=UPI0008396329|nr:DegT/DnrJ/EryC1/StrS family aminotransferase [Candidatus Protochlamydia phocaeensis]